MDVPPLHARESRPQFAVRMSAAQYLLPAKTVTSRYSAPLPVCRGDPSNEFRFASFFPTMIHPVVDQLADICSRVLQISTSAAGESSSIAVEGAPLPGSDSADATRRRYLSLPFAALQYLFYTGKAAEDLAWQGARRAGS